MLELCGIDPPIPVLEVIGTAISGRLKTGLFDEFPETPQGFRAVRPVPTGDVSQ
jgi:hypothetical protein